MLSNFELAHAKSIADPNPVLEPVPPLRRPTILVAAVIRKPPEVIQAWLETLAWQKFHEPVPTLSYAFIANCAANDAFRDASLELLNHTNALLATVEAPVGDYGDTPTTRAWSTASFGRMADLKNRLIQQALDTKVDYLFLVDADVLCDPYTLQALLDADSGVVSGVYWTNWQRAVPGTTSAAFQHAGPQVWLRHPYFLDDERYTEAEFREQLVKRQRLRVRGLGACTLIRRDALEAGLNFSRVDALPPGPMSEGEDRHFCARATRSHIPLVADAWPDIAHAYHPGEYDQIPQVMAQLATPHPERPTLGAMVSVRLDVLEPIQDAIGRQLMLQPKWVRGRLGALGTMPQIEETVAGLSVGESSIVRVMYPAHYPLGWLRSQTRLFQVTLLDCKVRRFAPTIDRELFTGATGTFMDSTTLTERQVREMLTTSAEVLA